MHSSPTVTGIAVVRWKNSKGWFLPPKEHFSVMLFQRALRRQSLLEHIPQLQQPSCCQRNESGPEMLPVQLYFHNRHQSFGFFRGPGAASLQLTQFRRLMQSFHLRASAFRNIS